MTVNHASVLKKEYFIAYFNLVLRSRASTLMEAKELIFTLFFHQKPEQYGNETFNQFLLAYEELTQREICC
ncbi:hypothetical protein [Bacillus pinisoli]|uniref:hypothetical protein n=1 Tax=Bacillus pinisoli TaxID=2901866 RepID=UPI001FF2AB57|nr:hypothetical protein [Bacillus pinisoli]